MNEPQVAPTGEPQTSTPATPPADAPATQVPEAERLRIEKAEADQKAAKAEADLVAEKVRSTIATQLLTSDTRLASPAALGVVEHLVAQKVAAGVEVAAAVGAVLTEHPYLKAAPPAAVFVEERPTTTGFSPAAGGTVSPATLAPAPVRDALTMTATEWAAHRKAIGL